LGFEPQFEETIRENHVRPQSYAMNPLFDLSNYASVPAERQDNSFIRFAQGKLTSSGNGSRPKIDNFSDSTANLIETVFFLSFRINLTIKIVETIIRRKIFV